MSQEISNLSGLVVQRGDEFITTSMQVAELFDMEHRNVLRAVKELKTKVIDLTVNDSVLCTLNFHADIQTVAMPRGGSREEPIFLLNKDEFSLLAMGFTGDRALKFKIAYISEFNRMEGEIKNRAAAELDKAADTTFSQYLDILHLNMLVDNKPKTKDQYQAELGIAALERENLVLKNTLMREQRENETLRDERERYYLKKSKK